MWSFFKTHFNPVIFVIYTLIYITSWTTCSESRKVSWCGFSLTPTITSYRPTISVDPKGPCSGQVTWRVMKYQQILPWADILIYMLMSPSWPLWDLLSQITDHWTQFYLNKVKTTQFWLLSAVCIARKLLFRIVIVILRINLWSTLWLPRIVIAKPR